MKRPRKTFLCAIAAGLVAALVVWFWPRPRAHLLLITLDTTRADRLGCYGYAAGRTPVLDALAKAGVLCERAYTVAPLTLPAHTSLFTGLYPAETGVRTNGHGRLDDAVPTLAEVLKRQGYDTAAFVASFVLDSRFGLDRGFKTYDDDFDAVETDPDSLHRQRPGAEVVDAALAWLGQPRSRPFFCWVHLYDPHFPYLAHTDLFEEEFAERPYDAEIAYVDQQVGRLVEYLKARRLDDQTLVVVVGDHGEALGEHLEQAHGSTLYDASMRVPLIFRHLSRLPPDRRLAANVSLVDVSATILELLRLPDSRKSTGKSIQSALLAGDVRASPCYGATDDPFLVNGWSPLRSLTEGDWKYIRTTKVELYNLATDPDELHNLAEADPGQTQEMESHMAEFESRLVARAESQVQLSAADRRALASLGYAAGGTAAPEGPVSASLPDVKDMLQLDTAVDDAVKLIDEGAVEAGIEGLRTVVRQAPTLVRASWALASALQSESKIDEALDVFHALLKNWPDCPHGHLGMGGLLLQRGELDAAIAELRKALEFDPELVEAHYNLAKALLSSGRLKDALAHLETVVQLDPRHAAAYQYRAYVRVRLGQIDEAIADYRQALKYAPHSSEAHHNLGIVLAEQGNTEEARQYLTRAVELEPQNAELQYSLGKFLVRRSQYAEALAYLTKALELAPDHAAAEAELQAAREALAGRAPRP